MEKIIHHLEAYLDKIFTVHAYGITDIDKTASELKKDSDELSRNILQVLIEEMNVTFREDKALRKELGLVIKEKERPRSILTELGEIRFNRDYYYNKKTESYEAPLDYMLSVKQRARIGDAICAGLVTEAAYESYERSSRKVTDGYVSRQTVRNCILKTPELEKEPESSEKKRCEILEVYADEDHVHLQKPGKEKGKRNKVVPLVTVTEGTMKISEGRNATVEAMHFVDEKMDAESIWESVEGYINKVYDVEALEEIRLHSDGGLWIRRGLENFVNVVRAMDKWHIQDRLRPLAKRYPKQQVQSRIISAITDKDREGAEAILGSLVRHCTNEKDFRQIQELQTYLFSNWEAITNAYKEGMSGSCTEGLVSHILSQRFSRNPMGWSEEGLGKLSKIRVYLKNGGELTADHFKEGYAANETYREYAKRCMAEVAGPYDLSWMSDMRESYVFDTASGTQQAIKNLGRIHNNLVC